MIFAEADHIEQIKKGAKTQTRRVYHAHSFNYRRGRTYGIRPCRTCKNIPDGRILILRQWFEYHGEKIDEADALAEGGYTPEEYEELFNKMHRKWRGRIAYEFEYVPT